MVIDGSVCHLLYMIRKHIRNQYKNNELELNCLARVIK